MNYSAFFEEFKQLMPLSSFDEEQIQRYFHPISLKKNEILINQNITCDKLFFICKGLLRIWYIDENGNEFTRRIAWEGTFVTNMESFRKGGVQNNETIECIEDAEVLMISKQDLDYLLSITKGLSDAYFKILEKYMGINTMRCQETSISCPVQKLIHFRKNYPMLQNRITDKVLASFLSISPKTLQRAKKKLIGK